jgi:small subunit ribosomal protein S13
MAYFLNTNVPDNKNIEIALTYVYGIGRKESINVCRKLGVNPKKKFKNLNNKLRNILLKYIEFNYTYGFHLRRLRKQNIEALVKIRSYRGSRHRLGYLVRGQRSKNKKSRRHFQ